MFDIGIAELSLLAVLGLLVLGPERLPAVARTLGGYVRKARRTWNTVRAEIEAELAAEDLRKTIQEPIDELDDLHRVASGAVDPAASAKPSAGDQGSETTKSDDG